MFHLDRFDCVTSRGMAVIASVVPALVAPATTEAPRSGAAWIIQSPRTSSSRSADSWTLVRHA